MFNIYRNDLVINKLTTKMVIGDPLLIFRSENIGKILTVGCEFRYTLKKYLTWVS